MQIKVLEMLMNARETNEHKGNPRGNDLASFSTDTPFVVTHAMWKFHMVKSDFTFEHKSYKIWKLFYSSS